MAFNSPVWFNVGASGSRAPQCSACQPYRARVSSPFGLVEIGEIVERNLVGFPVYDSNGITLVVGTKHNGKKVVYRVSLANGSFIEATGDHLVSALRERRTTPTWERVDQLEIGMRLRLASHRRAILAGEYVAELETVKAVEFAQVASEGPSASTRPLDDFPLRFAEGDVDVSEAALAGWAQADGFVGQYQEGTNRSLTVEFEVANAEERAWVLQHIEAAFPGLHWHESAHPSLPNYRKICLYGEVLRPFVEKYGLLDRREHIRVPQSLWTAKPAAIRAYLRSVFQCDGYVTINGSTSHVEVAVISPKWIEDLQLLLASRGIYSKRFRKTEKRANREDLWVVSIAYHSERAVFSGEIGFIANDKQTKLHESLGIDGKICPDERHEEIVSVEVLGEEDVYDIQTLSGEYLSNNVTVHNCFILSVDDEMESILEWFKTEGLIFKGGSGSGLNVSSLRSSKEHLSGGGYASGPVSFMRGADSVAGSIKSGGTTRRAAKMVVLNSDHPDIREFIWCKAKEERKAWALGEQGYDMSLNGEAWQSIQFQNANNSVRATDEFMYAAVESKPWGLKAVKSGDVVETVDPRELLREIAQAAWECGDPGMQFDTTINDWHTCSNTARINASNPCSEYMHVDDSACNLASLNLMRFLHADGEFDVEKFRRAVQVTITAQEIIVGNSSYPTAKIARNANAMRQLGLGYANLGAVLMQRGLPYDSDEGRGYAAAITSAMTGEAYAQSARIAANAEVGPFEAYAVNRDPMLRVIGKHRDAAYQIPDDKVPASLLSAARQAWDDALTLGGVYGFRNAQATVLAPTGTISFMMDCDTTGIEPDIALVKYKKLVGGGTLKLVNGTVPAALRRLGYSEEVTTAITTYITAEGTIEGAPGLKADHLPVFDCAFKATKGERYISHMGHIRMMGAVQPFLSGAISKTVNLPETATVEDVAEAYVRAWQHGVKAIAIYRDGSKKTQPVSTSDQN
ncbi:MAG: vitamin B12-dependent ribonucleotide reductase, partial [Chloroflexi bacterium]